MGGKSILLQTNQPNPPYYTLHPPFLPYSRTTQLCLPSPDIIFSIGLFVCLLAIYYIYSRLEYTKSTHIPNPTMASSSAADIDPNSNEESPPINFTVKTSKDEKYTLSLPTSTSVAELKSKLAELSQIEPGSQRLIFSGRVMKDEESLAFYKVQSGHTIHLVKGAASNQRASAGNVSGSGSGASSASSGQTQTPRVPTNLAAGAGNNPLAGLTGARYAGMAPLPDAGIFGPDGGVCFFLLSPLICNRLTASDNTDY